MLINRPVRNILALEVGLIYSDAYTHLHRQPTFLPPEFQLMYLGRSLPNHPPDMMFRSAYIIRRYVHPRRRSLSITSSGVLRVVRFYLVTLR